MVARGFSGYNTRQWVAISRELPASSLGADVAVLWLGANDASASSQQNVPIDEYKQNLKSIINTLKVYFTSRR